MLLLLTAPTTLSGQGAPTEERPVSLAEAVTEARRASPDVLAARARAEAARQGVRLAGAFQWPTVGLEAGAVRSDDPVAAFGGRLRQGRFTEADFDPARLNDPAPLTDWSAAVGVSWAPLDFSALAGREAAVREADAAGLSAAWATRAAAFRAEARYVEAVAAERRVASALLSEEAARSNLRVMERRLEEGVLTEADVLQARAALAGAEATLIEARRARDDSRELLGVAMGWPHGVLPIPTDTVFPSSAVPDGERGGGEVESRADLRASATQVAVRAAQVDQARRARLPALQGFARLETHSADPFDDVRDDWTVGVQLSVPLFTGFRVDAQARAASALREAAAREHDLRLREARAEVAGAERALEAAGLGAEAARTAARAADEATRLMRRRFEEGMTTPADLLAAEARAAELRARAVNAELMRHLAAARLAFLTDTDDLDRGMNP